MMIISVLQLIACLALLAVAVLKCFNESGFYRSLRPFIVVAAILGILLVAPYAMEILVAYHRGSIYEMEAISFRFNGPYRWVYTFGFVLPLLPIFGLLSAIGRKPALVSIMALLALIPVLFTPLVKFFTAIS